MTEFLVEKNAINFNCLQSTNIYFDTHIFIIILCKRNSEKDENQTEAFIFHDIVTIITLKQLNFSNYEQVDQNGLTFSTKLKMCISFFHISRERNEKIPYIRFDTKTIIKKLRTRFK